MAAINTTTQVENNYDRFIAELTALTRKYGVAIQSVGGVYLADERGEFDQLTYNADITSGDLYPNFSGN
ncbi:hypothetical protein [Limnohabitans lacus]|uniref:Uncharacterized protein n=1 Tax=Limnohabitans lacus TaxID=3045173 RepID=A0ABT6X8V4_9BURK|nr:hypothetical protein [Limnohabitans sp. HM2-2]MDI9234567.1 hypothetical protein [Limnohabitans sp. HM2-2]